MLFSNQNYLMNDHKHTLYQDCTHCAQIIFIMEFRTIDPARFHWSCVNCQKEHLNEEENPPYPDKFDLEDGTEIKKLKDENGLLIYEVDLPGITVRLYAKTDGDWIILRSYPPKRNFQFSSNTVIAYTVRQFVKKLCNLISILRSADDMTIINKTFDPDDVSEFMFEYLSYTDTVDYEAILKITQRMGVSTENIREITENALKQMIGNSIRICLSE